MPSHSALRALNKFSEQVLNSYLFCASQSGAFLLENRDGVCQCRGLTAQDDKVMMSLRPT